VNFKATVKKVQPAAHTGPPETGRGSSRRLAGNWRTGAGYAPGATNVLQHLASDRSPIPFAP
jgi:hypothetical protein